MKIYTGTPSGCVEKLDNIKRLKLGICVSATAPQKSDGSVPHFLDNGAYEAWRRGMPWLESRYLAFLDKCWGAGLAPDFVVAPDIVAGGMDSLEFSMRWAKRLRPARMAFAVQDGMEFSVIHELHGFELIFVGGTVEWKWATAKEWCKRAHDKRMKCHIGKVGTLENLKIAYQYGADSVDSTSWVRNDSWHIVQAFREWESNDIFGSPVLGEEPPAYQMSGAGTDA